MGMLVCRLFDKDDNQVYSIEKLRRDVFHVDIGDYFEHQINDGKITVLGCFFQDKLVGGAYLSSSFDSLFVESIFVKEEYQHHPLHIGSFMIQYIFEHKDIFEKMFHTTFSQCRLESRNQDSFYQNLGFRQENNIMGTMKRRS